MMRIEENTSLSVKMNVIEVKLAQEHRKVWAVFGNHEDMSVGEFQLHVACLGWSQHSGTNLRLRKI